MFKSLFEFVHVDEKSSSFLTHGTTSQKKNTQIMNKEINFIRVNEERVKKKKDGGGEMN
jgi:hypothetical protein